jgi:3-hydroxyisobutyrate dehydrogenase
VAAAAKEIVQSLMGNGYDDVDFAALLELQAKGSGLELVSEDAEVSDGLDEADLSPASS